MPQEIVLTAQRDQYGTLLIPHFAITRAQRASLPARGLDNRICVYSKTAIDSDTDPIALIEGKIKNGIECLFEFPDLLATDLAACFYASIIRITASGSADLYNLLLMLDMQSFDTYYGLGHVQTVDVPLSFS